MALTHKSALAAIAGMRVADDTKHAELSALCVAIATISLDSSATGSPVERRALEIIAGRAQCADNLMSHQDVARDAIARQDIPRRACVDRMVPAEKAIRDAILAIEALPADVRLTDAVILLGKAKDKVSDYVDQPT